MASVMRDRNRQFQKLVALLLAKLIGLSESTALLPNNIHKLNVLGHSLH